jgi:ABC-type glycerol-3-phosphate transport system substrate-binding protein
MEPSWFVTNNNQGLFAPIPMHHFEDDLGIEWNRGTLELTMKNGMPHGFAHGVDIAGGVFFNMRLLEEAGVARDLPFTLQAEDNWNWDTFIEMARRLSRDIDGDGIIDIWAITAFHQDVLYYALASNDAAYARVDPNTGRFVNSTHEDAFRETIEFLVQLREEGLAMHEDDVGGEWNAFVQEFNEGRGAIRVAGQHVAGGEINAVLEDDFGFVAFPHGPRRDTYMNWVNPNINAIPHFYSEEEVDNFMFAMQRWLRRLPTDDDDDWMLDARANHRDARSYTESIALYTRNADMQTAPAHSMMPGLGQLIGELFAWRVWNGTDSAVIIEESQQVWDAFIERVNNLGN